MDIPLKGIEITLFKLITSNNTVKVNPTLDLHSLTTLHYNNSLGWYKKDILWTLTIRKEIDFGLNQTLSKKNPPYE